MINIQRALYILLHKALTNQKVSGRTVNKCRVNETPNLLRTKVGKGITVINYYYIIIIIIHVSDLI